MVWKHWNGFPTQKMSKNVYLTYRLGKNDYWTQTMCNSPVEVMQMQIYTYED